MPSSNGFAQSVRKHLPKIRHAHKKIGLPPGELVFIGEEPDEAARLSLLAYDADHLDARPLPALDELGALPEAPAVTWINLDGVHDVQLVERLGERFGLHPLVLEDIVNTGQRPKAEDHDDFFFATLKMMRVGAEGRALPSEQVSLVVGPNYVLSFQERPGDVFDPVRDRLRAGRGRIRRAGAGYLAYALLDVIVDNYFAVLEHFGEQTEALEEEVLGDPGPEVQHQINHLRRSLISTRRAIWPVRELLATLDRSDSPLIASETHRFLRDVYDHAVQVIDILESLREVLAGLNDLYMSSLSNRMNEVMKVLTIIGTIFIPLTFVAGIYGMNFDHMPELHAEYGYPIALAAMLALALVLVVFFRRKGWL